MSVDDAIRPVDEWIKDFRKRVTGDGSDMWQAAKATVRPLIQKLLRTQQRAQERLEESNRAIIRHVEEQTTQHIYNLLRADKMQTDSEQKREEQASALMVAKAQEREARENLNMKMGIGSETAAALDSALKSGGLAPSNSVLDKISKLLSSESASAQSAMTKNLKKASLASK